MRLFRATALLSPALCAALVALDAPSSARADPPIQLPTFALPTPASAARLLASDADVATLRTRKTTAPWSDYFNRFRAVADGVLGADIASLADDTLARVAKAAALLELMGETPPGTRFTRYRDVAVLALKSVRGRDPTDLFGNGNLDPLQDSGRLQSMAEAYDLLRGRGVAGADDDAIRARLADWADAFMQDFQLPFQVNNWEIKAGSALVTVALSIGSGSAAQWLAQGLSWLNGALAKMGSSVGWYREGVHYLNYSLNNLASAAWHVLHATGTSWFAALRPFVRFSIDTRLPDGSSAPFEEGLPNSFPHHVLWAAYGGDGLANEMAWAWRESAKDTGNYENQQLHDATVFALMGPASEARAPSGSPTRIYGGDAAYAALRDGFGRTGRAALLFAAVDHATTEFIASRHNTRNPLDLVVSGAGQNLLPTSGGGPTVTTSPNRAYYLDPASKNVPLVGGTAPFVSDASQVRLADRLDGHLASGEPGFLDAVSMTVTGYGAARSVTRSLLLVGGELFVVADLVASSASVDFSIPWRGRGARTLGATTGSMLGASWTFRDAALDLTVAASSAATLATTSGFYAERWNTEETIAGARVDTHGSDVRLLSLLEPRAASAAARTTTSLSSGSTAAVRMERGDTRDTIAAANAAGASTLSAGELVASANVALVRERAGQVAAFAVLAGSSLRFGGRALLSSEAPLTLSLELGTNELRAVLSPDGPMGSVTLRFDDLPGIDLARRYGASFAGQGLDGSAFEQTPSGFRATLAGGGTLLVSTMLAPPDGGTHVVDGGAGADGGMTRDGGMTPDAGAAMDGGVGADGGPSPDGGPMADAGVRDGGLDAGPPGDGGARSDGGDADAGSTVDGGITDAGSSPRDAGTTGSTPSPGCSLGGEDLAFPWAVVVAFAWAARSRRRRLRR